jgi:hypothetical protein
MELGCEPTVLLATLDAARTPGEPGLRCEKCAGTDISVRWDSNFYDCLHVQQERSDWPRDGGEHLHRQCRTCGWTWAAALSQPAEAEHDEWCDGSGSSAGSACCRLAAQPRQEAPSE